MSQAQPGWAGSSPQQPWQPFILSEDAATVSGGSVAVATGAGYDGVSHQAGAPGAPTTGLGELWLNGAVGITNWMELHGFAGMTSASAGTNLDHGLAELRFKLLDQPGGAPMILTLSGGWQVDYQHENAVESALTFTARPGPLHLTTSFQAAHYFAQGRDGADLALSAGATYRVLQGIEAGMEYLAEELEGVAGGADVDIGKGGRQWFGPSASALIPQTTLRVNLGAGEVWTSAKGGAFVRASLGYVF
jgi:hypothetical protein